LTNYAQAWEQLGIVFTNIANNCLDTASQYKQVDSLWNQLGGHGVANFAPIGRTAAYTKTRTRMRTTRARAVNGTGGGAVETKLASEILGYIKTHNLNSFRPGVLVNAKLGTKPQINRALHTMVGLHQIKATGRGVYAPSVQM
jgi:hypothetical protein